MWPKGPTYWVESRVLNVSIPFTWNLPAVRHALMCRDLFWDTAIVGGPAVELMPDYLTGMSWVTIGRDCPGVLQRINPLATRTTEGCTRTCGFCGIGSGKIEGGGIPSPNRLARLASSLRQQSSRCAYRAFRQGD